MGMVLPERLPLWVVLIYGKLAFKSTVIGSMRLHLKAKTIKKKSRAQMSNRRHWSDEVGGGKTEKEVLCASAE